MTNRVFPENPTLDSQLGADRVPSAEPQTPDRQLRVATTLFARVFARIEAGLASPPVSLIDAVRALPMEPLPPPWLFWVVLRIVALQALRRRAWECLESVLPLEWPRDENGNLKSSVDVETADFSYDIDLFGGFAYVYLHSNSVCFRFSVRIDQTREPMTVHTYGTMPPMDELDITSDDDWPPLDFIRRRMQEWLPSATRNYCSDLHGLFIFEQGICLVHDLRCLGEISRCLQANPDHERVVPDVLRAAETPQGQIWLAALAGDWFLVEQLAESVGDQALVEEAGRRVEACIASWHANPHCNIVAFDDGNTPPWNWQPCIKRALRQRRGKRPK